MTMHKTLHARDNEDEQNVSRKEGKSGLAITEDHIEFDILWILHLQRFDKVLDLARELKNLWDMKGRVIPVTVGALGIFTKVLEKR